MRPPRPPLGRDNLEVFTYQLQPPTPSIESVSGVPDTSSCHRLRRRVRPVLGPLNVLRSTQQLVRIESKWVVCWRLVKNIRSLGGTVVIIFYVIPYQGRSPPQMCSPFTGHPFTRYLLSGTVYTGPLRECDDCPSSRKGVRGLVSASVNRPQPGSRPDSPSCTSTQPRLGQGAEVEERRPRGPVSGLFCSFV